MQYKYLPFLLSAAVLIFVSGCTSTLKVKTSTPNLNITRQITDAPANHTTVSFEPFKIVSKDPVPQNVIGEAKVGPFNTPAKIIDSEPADKRVADAVKSGFQHAGFNLVDSQDADFTVSGAVERFWVDEYATGMSMEYSKASVRFDLLIKNRQGAIVWANTLEQFKTSDKSFETTANDLPTLSLALKSAVEAIFKDPTFWKAVAK